MRKATDQQKRFEAAQAALRPATTKKGRSPQGSLSFAAAISCCADRLYAVIRRCRRADGTPEVRYLNVDRETHEVFVTGIGPDRHHVTIEDITADNWQESM